MAVRSSEPIEDNQKAAFMMKSSESIRDPEEIVTALVLPQQDKTPEEVENWLRENGAEEVTLLGATFLSVVASRATLKAVENIARVELKPLKRMH